MDIKYFMVETSERTVAYTLVRNDAGQMVVALENELGHDTTNRIITDDRGAELSYLSQHELMDEIYNAADQYRTQSA